MQKSNPKLDSFISEITSGEGTPIPESAELIEESIWSGEIAEIDEVTFGSYRDGNAGAPKMVMDDWFVFSDAKLVTDPGILFWQNGDQFFARRLDQDEWDKFLKVAKVKKKFW